MTKKNYDTVTVHYPDEKLWVTLKVFPGQIPEDAKNLWEERRGMSNSSMRKKVGTIMGKKIGRGH
jgi:hypothetical protein